MLVSAAVDGFHEAGVACALKHFPRGRERPLGQSNGPGLHRENLAGDADLRNLSLPGGDGHRRRRRPGLPHDCPQRRSRRLPASLSREMITEKLRGELRFQRVILTDSPVRPGHHRHLFRRPSRPAGLPGRRGSAADAGGPPRSLRRPSSPPWRRGPFPRNGWIKVFCGFCS